MSKDSLTNEEWKTVWEIRRQNEILTWAAFAEVCNLKLGKNLDESAYRKWIQNVEKAAVILESDLSSEKVLELMVKRKENNLLKAQLNKDINDKAKLNIVISELCEQIKPFEVSTESLLGKQEATYNQKNHTHLFVISDMQEDGLNFSNTVFDSVYRKIVKVLDDKDIPNNATIELWENGDGIDGALRQAALAQNTKSIVGQIQIYWTELVNFLDRLSKRVKINFSMVNSNHTELRLMNTGRGEMKEDDVTVLILEFIKASFKDSKRVNIVNNDNLNFKIHNYSGYKVFQHHGDNKMKPKNLEQYLKDISTYFEPVDIVIVSHVHHFRYTSVNRNKLKGGDYSVITTPALDPRMYKSNEEFLMLSSEPAFMYLEITPNNGITEIKKINTKVWLEKKPELEVK